MTNHWIFYGVQKIEKIKKYSAAEVSPLKYTVVKCRVGPIKVPTFCTTNGKSLITFNVSFVEKNQSMSPPF